MKDERTSLFTDAPHECRFVEEQEPSGRLILGPCLVCGLSAMDAMEQLRSADEMLRIAAADTSYADLRQNIEFMRTAVSEALDTLEERTACHCHLWVEFPRIQEIKGPNPPRACPRCKAIDRIRGEIAQVTS